MDKRVDLICQHTMDGKIIPLKLRFQDEDGELQEFLVKGYNYKSIINWHKKYNVII